MDNGWQVKEQGMSGWSRRITNRSINCLLVDADAQATATLANALAGEPVRVLTATTSEQALTLAREHEVAIAIVTAEASSGLGFELAAQLQDMGQMIPIVFVGPQPGEEDAEDALDGYQLAAVDYLTKPINPLVLRSKVRVIAELHWQRLRLRTQLAKLRNGKKEAERALAARDRLISVAGHELRTPLSVLCLQLQLMQRRLPPADEPMPAGEVRDTLSQIERQVSRLLPLLEEMLDASNLQKGELTIRPERCDLAALTVEVVSRLRPLLEETGCTLELEVPRVLWGYWDNHRLEQVLINLLTNAARYSGGAAVKVSVRRFGELVELAVIDYGKGIGRAHHQRIFDAFERVDDNDTLGLGLGLHIVRSIVEQHGGKIRLESAPGAGAAFHVRLPLMAPSLPPAEDRAPPVGQIASL